ncbi:MAG: retropepsin-like domain-containing protein [Sphingomonadaceae bacterium]|nr:retropepsin-like domain-containing protein [Sphingomonadaceae bacterium]
MLDAIPFDTPNRMPFVVMEARVAAGTPARVLLDTGNAAPVAMLVSPALAARAGLAPSNDGAARPAVGLGDAATGYRSARLSRIAIGALTFDDLEVGVSGAVDAVSRQLGSNVDAILGHRFVEGRTVSIDYGRHLVDFDAGAGPAAQATPFTLAPARPLTLVRVTINGRGPFLMVLDSGASTSLVSPETAATAGIDAGQNAQLGGAGGTVAGGARLGRARITLGGLTRDGQPVAVADVLGPIRAAAGAPIDGVLGADLFGSGRITLDYATNRFWYEENRAGR